MIQFDSLEARQFLSGSHSSVIAPTGPQGTRGDDKGGVIRTGASGSSASSSSVRSGDKSPLFDFRDNFYLQNGFDPTKIAGRPNGTGGSVVDVTSDPTRRNIRMTALNGMHDDGGNPNFFAVLGTIKADAFTNNAAGRTARAIADKYVAYIFPKSGSNPLSPASKRQDELIPLNNGYFSNDPTQVWREVFVNYIAGSMNSGNGKKVADDLIRQNGRDADGTPYIRTLSDLQKAQDAGIVSVQRRADDGSQGAPWFFCAVFKDFRGGITADSTLTVAKDANGATTQSSRDIESLFNQLKPIV